MKNINLNFRPETYFNDSKEQDVCILTIYFLENVEIKLNTRKNKDDLEYYLTDNIDEEDYKYSFENLNSKRTKTLKEIIEIIQSDIRDCEGKDNIIFGEWEFLYYQHEGINLKVKSDIYRDLEKYFDNLISEFHEITERKIEANRKYDPLIYDHIERSNLTELISNMKKTKFGVFGLGVVRENVYKYVKSYYSKNKKLPFGVHTIEGQTVSFKSEVWLIELSLNTTKYYFP